MRPVNTVIQTTVFQLVLNMQHHVDPATAFKIIRTVTDENPADLIPELAHCAQQAKAGLNAECFDYFRAVLDCAFSA